jgi:hypothetical protein
MIFSITNKLKQVYVLVLACFTFKKENKGKNTQKKFDKQA